MPLGVADYTVFNTLAVSAPEIRGLWNFTLVPGVMGEDGVINRSTTGGGPCTMMFPSASDKDAAWTFMKWWVSTDTQVRFGREMEAVMGAAARYATANKEAFEQLAWSVSQRNVLQQQWEWVVGTPEVPGGYYTSRHILNAFRRVRNNNEDARETLIDYTRIINEELDKKRREFGLVD
jgi:ABC-type glycerol-3-phosphate transport system substrate-binding protein